MKTTDYYPGGMPMPGRSYSSDKYRFGFNGKENDNEVKGTGNQQDYGMRIYDPRIVRFLSVDPIAKDYPELTPYQFASNRMIDGVDQDGLEYIGYKVVSVNDQGQCQIKLTGRVDYKNWILNATNGLWGLFKLPVASVEYNGRHYLFKMNKLNNINIKDFNNDRPTEEGIDALFTLTGVLGGVATSGKGNDVINTASEAMSKFEEISSNVKAAASEEKDNAKGSSDNSSTKANKEKPKEKPKGKPIKSDNKKNRLNKN